MSDSLHRLHTTLKGHSLSITRPRQAVFTALENHEPQTMAEVIKKLPEIDRASVYRTVELFEKLGIVQKIQFGWKYKLELSDQFQDHHHHLTCTNCGLIIPLKEDASLEAQLEKLAQKNNFTSKTHQLEIQGLCQNCQKS